MRETNETRRADARKISVFFASRWMSALVVATEAIAIP